MNVKEKIKIKVEQLDKKELRSLSDYIDQMLLNRKPESGVVRGNEQPYKDAVKLLRKHPLTTQDILAERRDRV
jgi:ureidoglycolate hydrolase